MKRLLCILAVLAMTTSVFTFEMSAKAKRVTAEGRCIQEEHMTGKLAKEFALRRAKEDALRQAGIEERVWSVFGMMSSSDQNDQAFFDAWSETSFVMIDGIVKTVECKYKTEWNESVGLPEQKVLLVADVEDSQQKTDPAYKLQIDGLKDVYNDGEKFSCNIRVFGADSYLKVFYFNNNDANLIYPEGMGLDEKYIQETQYRVPAAGSIEAFKDSGDETVFANLVFVMTKRKYSYTTKPTPKNIMSWIYSIPADERVVEMRNIMIR